MVEPGIEPGTSWLVVRSSDHQTTRLVKRHFEVEMQIFFLVLKSAVRMVTAGLERVNKFRVFRVPVLMQHFLVRWCRNM
jgi:hypothetical protein